MEEKKVKIACLRYADGHKIENGVLVPTIKEMEVVMNSTKRFHNCIHQLLGLNRLQRMLIDWLSEEMDDRNMVKNDKYTRDKFVAFLAEVDYEGKKDKPYEDQSVANAFHGLGKKGMLKSHSRMYYQVNPEYYWKGSDKDRLDNIMLNIQFASKATNFKVMSSDKYEVKLRK